MLALAAVNAAGTILFGALYAAAAADVIPQGGFLVALSVVFGLVTALWVRTEADHRGAPPLRRASRALMALVLALMATPALILMPLFWLDGQLPPEVGVHRWLSGAMAVLLIALVLVVLVNLAGCLWIVVRALAASPGHTPR